MGNYSRFIRSGFIRMETIGGNDALLVSAFRSEDDQRWVVVAANQATRPVTLRLEARQGQLPDAIAQFETSEQANLAPVDSGSEPDTWVLAPLSVTTLVMDT
jgi:hypothetical protein